MKRSAVVLLLVLLVMAFHSGLAQDESNVTIFFIACGDAAVMNLSGQMEAGFDVYYQVFSGPSGTGNALTALRRVQVNGGYTFSERIVYDGGATVATAAIASARVMIGRETDSSRTIFDTTVNDLQDGCNSPQFAPSSSLSAAPTPAPVTGTTPSGPPIASPFGGFLTPAEATPEPVVVIGPRQSAVEGRAVTPGLIFAECDKYRDRAEPGIIYDSDNVMIFWSWFARTPEQIDDHLLHAQYVVKLNTAALPYVQIQPIQQIGRNYFAFYVATVGNLEPGHYEVAYDLTWDAPINDGVADYGPGTEHEREASLCNFDVAPNPFGVEVDHTDMYHSTAGPVHELP